MDNYNSGASSQQSNTNVEHSQSSNQPATSSNAPARRRRSNQVISAACYGGRIDAPNARFSPNGDQHNVRIILRKINEEEGATMKLFVDEVMIYQVAITRRRTLGRAELFIDGKNVEFLFDLNEDPLEFYFRTKIEGVGGSEIYEEASEHVEDHYTLLILGGS